MIDWLKESWFKIWIALVIGIIGLAIAYNQIYLASKRHNLEIVKEIRIGHDEFSGEARESYLEAVKRTQGLPGKLFKGW